jgi:hypothetical protein
MQGRKSETPSTSKTNCNTGESGKAKGETADLKDLGSVEIQYKIFEIFKILKIFKIPLKS